MTQRRESVNKATKATEQLEISQEFLKDTLKSATHCLVSGTQLRENPFYSNMLKRVKKEGSGAPGPGELGQRSKSADLLWGYSLHLPIILKSGSKFFE